MYLIIKKFNYFDREFRSYENICKSCSNIVDLENLSSIVSIKTNVPC